MCAHACASTHTCANTCMLTHQLATTPPSPNLGRLPRPLHSLTALPTPHSERRGHTENPGVREDETSPLPAVEMGQSRATKGELPPRQGCSL